MDPFIQDNTRATAVSATSRFMSRVYGWMTFGLMITAGVGYVIGSDPYTARQFMGGAFWLIMIAQFGLVIGLTAGINRMSVGVATGCFLLYSAMMGVTISSIFLIYPLANIGQVFLITAGTFGGLALYGAVTKRDLTAMGTFMIMGVWGVIVASLVNIFLRSPGLNFTISLASVVIFSALTAYDTQKLKVISRQGDIDSDAGHKYAIIGALSLYLDFLNLFLALLRIFGGGRRD